MATADSGWGWPLNSKKAHFFIGGRSFCGKWMFFGSKLEPFGEQTEAGPNDCKACFKKALLAHPKKPRQGRRRSL